MNISVVIPAYNEEEHLGECLRALANGRMKPYEVIVADGMSEDRTVSIAKEHGATVVVNRKRHAAGGRNAGIERATGEVIAFLDADCVPDKDWLREINRAFESEDIDGLGTYIEPAKAENIYEEFWGHLSLQLIMTYGDKPYYVTEKTLSSAFITASCAYKRELLNRLNGFSDFFANNAEDIDICWRALDAGAKLKYIPSAKIAAHSPRDIKGIRRKSFRNGISSSKLQKVYSNRRFNIDRRLYGALLSNLVGVITRKKYARLFVVEILCHLAGKYYGSIKYGVINL